LAIPAMIHISGVAIPTPLMKDVFSATADVGKMMSNGKIDYGQLVKDIVPMGLTAAGIAIPGAGIAVAAVVLMVTYSKPPTKADQQRMWDRAQGVP
jgi:hypothetical protein